MQTKKRSHLSTEGIGSVTDDRTDLQDDEYSPSQSEDDFIDDASEDDGDYVSDESEKARPQQKKKLKLIVSKK